MSCTRCMAMCAQVDVDLAQQAGIPAHPGCPQVLRLESRVLELELHGDHAASVETGPGHLQAFARELEQKAKGQGHGNHHILQVNI